MFFLPNFHILALFQKLQIGRKIVKTHGFLTIFTFTTLTTLLFREIFRHLKLS